MAENRLEHQEDPEIREIALYYIKNKTTFLDIQYEGCFRGYEIYVPRMSDGGMEAITMLLAIHPHHENIFSLKGQAMDVILHELNFTSMRSSILKHPAIGPLSDIQWIATFNSKDVLRIVNKDGSPEAVSRYIYCTYSANWRLVRGDEIPELVNFLPSVEQQNEAISLAKENGFQTACYIGKFEDHLVYNVHYMPPCYEFGLAGILQKDGNTILFDEKNKFHKKIFKLAQIHMQQHMLADDDEIEDNLKNYIKTEKITYKFCKEHQLTLQAVLGRWAGMTVKLAYHVKTDLATLLTKSHSDGKIIWKYLLVTNKKVIECPSCLIDQVRAEYLPFNEYYEYKTAIPAPFPFKPTKDEFAADTIINLTNLINASAEEYAAADGCKEVLNYIKDDYSPKLTSKSALALIEKIQSFYYGMTKESLKHDVVVMTKARQAFKQRYAEFCDAKILNEIAKFRYPYEAIFFETHASDFR